MVYFEFTVSSDWVLPRWTRSVSFSWKAVMENKRAQNGTFLHFFSEMKNSDELWKFLLRKNNQCSLQKSSFRVLPEVRIGFLRAQTSFYIDKILQISSSDVRGAQHTKFTLEHRTLYSLVHDSLFSCFVLRLSSVTLRAKIVCANTAIISLRFRWIRSMR